MNYVYVLKSTVDGELYIGSTNDLKRRIGEHNNGKVKCMGYPQFCCVLIDIHVV